MARKKKNKMKNCFKNIFVMWAHLSFTIRLLSHLDSYFDKRQTSHPPIAFSETIIYLWSTSYLVTMRQSSDPPSQQDSLPVSHPANLPILKPGIQKSRYPAIWIMIHRIDQISDEFTKNFCQNNTPASQSPSQNKLHN